MIFNVKILILTILISQSKVLDFLRMLKLADFLDCFMSTDYLFLAYDINS